MNRTWQLTMAKTPLQANIKMNPALQDSPPAADRFRDIFPLRRSAIPPGGLFVIQEIRRNFLYHKKVSGFAAYYACSGLHWQHFPLRRSVILPEGFTL